MRFHFGFSKFIKPSKLLYWLGLGFFGLLAWLGLTQQEVLALVDDDVYEYDMVGTWGDMSYNYISYGDSITSDTVTTPDNCNTPRNVMTSGYCQLYGGTGMTRNRYLTVNNRTWSGGSNCSTSQPLSTQYITNKQNKTLTGVPSLCPSSTYEAMDIIYKVLIGSEFGEQNTNFTTGWLWYIYDSLTPPSTDVNDYIGAYITPVDPNSQNIEYSHNCTFTHDAQDIGNSTNTSLPALTANNEYYVVCPNNLINNGTTETYDRYVLTIYNKLVYNNDVTDDTYYKIETRWHTGTATNYCPNLDRVTGVTNGYHSIYYKCKTNYIPPDDDPYTAYGYSNITMGGSSGGHCFGDNCISTETTENTLDLSFYNDLDIPQSLIDLIQLPIRLVSLLSTSIADDVCQPITIDLSSITYRWGGFNYSLSLPCMRTVLSNLLDVDIIGTINLYALADMLMAFGLSLWFGQKLWLVINDMLTGHDLHDYLVIDHKRDFKR